MSNNRAATAITSTADVSPAVAAAAAPAADLPRGLAGVVVTETALGDVRGLEGFYHYRQYSAVELARTRGFEDVWHLLVHGELPDPARSAAFAARIAPLRRLPQEVRAALPAIAAATGSAGPLAGLRSALSLLGAASGFRPLYDIDADRRRADTLAACAAVPTLLTALYRLGKGLEPVEPREDLPYAANYLYMVMGSEPDAVRARAVEQYLISTIDHGFNASTFTARVIASTGADVAACLVGAVGALSGPLHGARRAVPWTPWTRSAPSSASTRGSVRGSSPGSASWASGTPSTAPRTRAPGCSVASRRSSAAPWPTSPSRSNTGWRRSWPN